MKMIATVVLLAMAMLTGCGDKGAAEAEKYQAAVRQSFDQAPEDLKAKYADLKAAVEAGDFEKAKRGLQAMTAVQLTPEQEQAVAEQRSELMRKVAAAMQAGDQNAVNLMMELRRIR